MIRAFAFVSVAVAVALVACGDDDVTVGVPLSDAGTTLDSTVVVPPNDADISKDAGADAAPIVPQECADAGPKINPATTSTRGSNNAALVRTSYDYAPTIMHDGNYRMWWCGGIAGDHVLYAEASNLDGPWHAHASTAANSYDDVFQPTGVVGDFDGAHTCDPSVIRVNGTYYMYYGGLGKDGTADNTTRLGLATSSDGFTWARQNGGKPIINPAQSLVGKPNQYGAGQPSAFYKDGYFYISFTDSSAAGTNQVNGAGQFILRSKDSNFLAGVEELRATGFIPQPANSTRVYSLTEAFSPDWTYVPAVDMYMMAVDGDPVLQQLRFFDRNFKFVETATIPFTWSEGPGIVKRPDGQLDPGSACDRIHVDLMRAVGNGTDNWDLAHSGGDVLTGTKCECVPWASVLEGSLMTVAGKPLTLVRAAKRLQFALAAPATRIARTSVAVTDQIFDSIPFGASMQSAAPAVGAPSRPAAFKLDNDTLWPASCLEIFTDNGSSLATITTAAFDALPQGPSLYCAK